MQFLEFMEISKQVESMFGTRIGALTDEEYTAITKLFEEAGVEEEVSQVVCSPKRASRGLLSLAALVHEQEYHEQTPYRVVRRQQALEEVKRIVAWL